MMALGIYGQHTLLLVIKFNNGILINFGVHGTSYSNTWSGVTITLPMAYSTIYTCQATGRTGDGAAIVSARRTNNSSFYLHYTGYDNNSIQGRYWLTIGY